MINTKKPELIPVAEAEKIIISERRDFGSETVAFSSSADRLLAEDIFADRDIPPFNRVAMDGIAIRFAAIEKGINEFHICGVQAAGASPVEIGNENDCIEIMTGAVLPETTDTVIRYEDIELKNGKASLRNTQITRGQHIHFRASDKKKKEILLRRGALISPALISILASVGKSEVKVKKLPSVIIISTGDELTEVDETPSSLQIRRSNSYAIGSALEAWGVNAVLQHIPDDREQTIEKVKEALDRFDVIILSGGISMGRFDFVEQAMNACGVSKRFYKVQQKPGKPFWFGVHPSGNTVFAFPGNPVSTFMCLYRYFIPWLQACLDMSAPPIYAVLGEDVQFRPALHYFLQVLLNFGEDGQLNAQPLAGNGSGDFTGLADSDAFIELPASKEIFKKGEVYRVWPYKKIFA